MCATSSRGSADEGGAGGIGGSHRQDGSRADFEASFRSFHDTVPVIHQMTSKDLSAGELGGDRFRFVHVDGSHIYEAATEDVGLASEIATEGGVVAFDDFANVGHPGVAAALWPAVMERDLEPYAWSPSKLYATRENDLADRYREGLRGGRCGKRIPLQVDGFPGATS
jgi:methyltransferase family protein